MATEAEANRKVWGVKKPDVMSESFYSECKGVVLPFTLLRLRAKVCSLIIHELSYFTILQKVNVGWSCHSWCCVR